MNKNDIVTFMRNRKLIIGLVAAAVVAMALFAIFTGSSKAPNTSLQQPAPQPAQTEQNNEPQTTPEEDVAVELDVTTQSFTLVGSNVSCSSTTVNGQTSDSCSGTISIVPLTKPDHDPALYKINEQTKLVHDNQEQDIQNLQQLATNKTTIRLAFAPDSIETLATITY